MIRILSKRGGVRLEWRIRRRLRRHRRETTQSRLWSRAISAQELPAMLCAEETPKQYRKRTMSAPLSGRINIGSIRATTMAVFAIFISSAGIAHAQFLFWPQYTFWPGHY